MTEGNTAYTIYLLYEVGGRYAMEMTLKVNVEMTDQFGPYLRPNQFVNYTKSTKVVWRNHFKKILLETLFLVG